MFDYENTVKKYQRIQPEVQELQDQGLPEQLKLNRQLVQLGSKLNIPLVATNDVHYVYPDQARAHDVLLCIQTGKTVDDPDRLRFPTPQFYLKSPTEMAALFAEVPDALANTLSIAERCNFDFSFGSLHLPAYKIPDEKEGAVGFLYRLCCQGLRNRGLDDDSSAWERLRRELDVIKKMDYPGYFLVVWDIVNYARSKGIPVGPGRGSAAGSLVAYCLGITAVNPLRYNLLFERFLNPERVSMPDIDIDFCYERREEVINYVLEKYGRQHVAQIITFGTMAARAAVRDVGRVLGVPLGEVDKIAKMVPLEPGITLERALNTSPELKNIYHNKFNVRELLDTARAIEGMPRHASTHAAGVVISPKPLTYYLPLQKSGDVVTTQYPMQVVEDLGLLKMDLLGLRTLSVIGHTCEAVRTNHGIDLNMEKLPLQDKATYKLLASGETSGIFQLESSGMRSILKDLNPERFEDIIALVALYRPGPLGSGMVEDFIQRKHGEIPLSYLHSSLEPILKETYGVILYQEQVMRIASELAGFTLGQADLLRRAMGKKQPEVLAAQRNLFIEGATKRGLPGEIAEQVFELMEYFAGYGFNASHSAAYALVAYQTAYLKAHYPAEMMAALLTSVDENFEKMSFYLSECQRLGLEVLPPDVNQSGVDFTVKGRQIRFGLAAIKNVGRAAVEAILTARKKDGPFKSFLDFCYRVDSRQANKRVVESLVRCGAFNSLGANRRQLMFMLDTYFDLAAKRQEDRRSGQLSFMDVVPSQKIIEPSLPQLDDFCRADILAAEKELLGFYLSGHPLEPFAKAFNRHISHNLADLVAAADDSQVVIGGLVRNIRRIITKKGDPMAYLLLEDFSSLVEVVLFPRVYSQGQSWLAPDQVVIVHGHLNKQEQEVQVLAEHIQPLQAKKTGQLLKPKCPSVSVSSQRLFLKLDDRRQLKNIQDILSTSPGRCQVYVYLPTKRRTFVLEQNLWVEPTAEMLASLMELLGGKDKVKIVAGKL